MFTPPETFTYNPPNFKILEITLGTLHPNVTFWQVSDVLPKKTRNATNDKQ